MVKITAEGWIHDHCTWCDAYLLMPYYKLGMKVYDFWFYKEQKQTISFEKGFQLLIVEVLLR